MTGPEGPKGPLDRRADNIAAQYYLVLHLRLRGPAGPLALGLLLILICCAN